jgi:hypothetical protein
MNEQLHLFEDGTEARIELPSYDEMMLHVRTHSLVHGQDDVWCAFCKARGVLLYDEPCRLTRRRETSVRSLLGDLLEEA